MAYNTNAAYQPPRRGYGGGHQQHQQAPVQNGYGYGGQEQYGYKQNQHYEQQGYGNGGYEQEARYDQQGQYNGGYEQSYNEPQRRHQKQSNGYGQPPMREERQYDPRYQQRPAGGRAPDGYEQQAPPPQERQRDPRYQQHRQAGAKQQAGYDQPQYGQRHEQGRHANGHPAQQEPQYDPRYQQQPQQGRDMNVYHQQQRPDDRQYDPRAQQNPPLRQKASRGQLPQQPAAPPEPSPAPVHGLDLQSKPSPANVRQYAQQQMEQQKQAASKQRAQGMTPQPQPIQTNGFSQGSHQSPPQKPNPSKMTMEEWKAQAKAKMHADAARPETLAQDNAFPTFPTYEHKSKGSSSTANTEARKGDEPPRPSTSTGVSRPSTTRDSSFNREASNSAGQHDLPRPSLDHKPFSFDAIHKQSQPLSPPQEPPQPQNQGSASAHTSPMQERPPQNWPTQGAPQQHPPPQPQPDRRQPPQRAPQTQPIDTRQVQEQRAVPGYMDHQPLSPASMSARPSTAQAGRHGHGQGTASPPGGYGHRPPQDQQYTGTAAQPPKAWAQQQQQSPPQHLQQPQQSNPRDTVADIYDDYHARRVPPPQIAPERTREEEIEAEMPDFDSAAPGGMSLLHKRSQKFEQQTSDPSAAPPMPSMPPQQQQQPNHYGQPPKPHQQGGITHGFAFGIPGEQPPPQQTYDDPYQQQGYAPPQQQRGPPVQAPFAQEQVPRRSMDDARQVPYRQGPPHQQQRPPRNGGPPNGYPPSGHPPNGHPPRGPMPPHMRPDMERGYTSHTVRSDPGPGQHRGGSAPPMRQAVHGPPTAAGPNGAPLAQPRSAPHQQDPQQRHSNPDALPKHPVPVRPGLMQGGPPQQDKPPPVRNYNGTSPPQQQAHPRQPSIDITSKPVTHAELDQLRAAVSANPNNLKASLALAKRLVEASTVLASENGRLDRQSTAKNRERYVNDAHKLVKRLVAQNYPDAQFYMADCYGSGQLGLESDPREAFNLYQAAAKGGHAEAAFRTAMCCELGAEDGGGTRRDYAKALQWYRRAATLGDPNGAFKLGIILLKGLLGQPKNIGEAVTWLKRAAERATKENPQALYEMAQVYESANANPEIRNKVVADDGYARELFTQAAQWGHKGAQFRLGQAYEYGTLALPIDNRASITWYTKAAAQGEHNAELALSGWYLTGADNILEQSDTEAYLWARKAATSEPPLAKAMFAMGYFTETGIGCPSSVEEAKRWYGRAASYKFPKAQERLDELRRTGGKGSKPAPVNGKLARKDQKRDEAECAVM